ncbi:MAG: lipoate--protein ligase family protein [Candidatus Bathyarchaeia archaeon]
MFNLALEESMVRSRREELCPDTLRLWRNTNSVILGCHTRLQEEVNLNACVEMGLKIVRRMSGGGAVYHDLGNLNYTVIEKGNLSDVYEDVVEAYMAFSKAILLGLERLNVKAEFHPPNLILTDGKKVSGMAQHRFYDVTLLHGTLLVDSNLDAISKALLNPRHQVANITDQAGRRLNMRQVVRALIEGFENAFNVRLNPGRLSPHEVALAQSLVKLKYGLPRWNLKDEEPTNIP